VSSPNQPIQSYGSGAYGNPPIEALELGYYLNLVSSEYRNSPKFLKFLTVLLQKFQDVTHTLVALDAALDVDNAIGPQLDQIGSVVGADRTVGFQPSGGVSPILDDATYRIYIKARAAQNTWDGTIDSLQPIWSVLFPGGSITIGDNQNMTANIFIQGTFTSIEKDLITNGYIVPRPQAVLYDYVFGPFPILGFGHLNPTMIAGFGVGHFTES
jgi:hypothetical protein